LSPPDQSKTGRALDNPSPFCGVKTSDPGSQPAGDIPSLEAISLLKIWKSAWTPSADWRDFTGLLANPAGYQTLPILHFFALTFPD
jgi:hypothetical protein